MGYKAFRLLVIVQLTNEIFANELTSGPVSRTLTLEINSRRKLSSSLPSM